jgi:hypothetical protein
MDLSFPKSGSVRETDLPALVRTICLAEVGGEMKFRREEVRKSIFFQDGKIVNATSSDPDDRLGEYLLKTGAITATQYLESVKHIRPGRKQGTILCEMNAMSPEEMMHGVRGHVLEIICDAMNWDDGWWEFEEKTLPESVYSFGLPYEEVVLAAIRKARFWSKFYTGLGSTLQTILEKTPESDNLFYQLELTEDESHVFSLINGKFTVGEICALSYLSNFETMRHLWSFLHIGAARLLSHGEESDRRGEGISLEEEYRLQDLVEDYNILFSRIYDFVFERIGDLVNHLCDRAVEEAQEEFSPCLGHIQMRSRGHVDYEQLLANTASFSPEARREKLEACLFGLGRTVVDLVERELGKDERAVLLAALGQLSSPAAEKVCRAG